MAQNIRHYGPLVLALMSGACLIAFEDAPLSAAIVVAAGLLAFAIQDAMLQHCNFSYQLALDTIPDTAPTPVATQPADPRSRKDRADARARMMVRSEYEQYCNALAADDWAADQCDALLDEYDALPMCPVMDCPNKQSQCFAHRYFGLDYTPPVATEDKIKPAPAPRKRARKPKLSADAIASTALPVMLTLEA